MITATQMLESMIKNPRPTRAEAADVANAIYDGTSAIMLSGETASGLYPVESFLTMIRIAERAERDIDYLKAFKDNEDDDQAPNVTNAISHATCTSAHDLGAKAIITVTKSGKTAKMISRFRPACPIVGCTTDMHVYRQLSLAWGVIPLYIEEKDNTDSLFSCAVSAAELAGLISSGDIVVITAGVPIGVSGTTNLMKVHLVGHILVTGMGITPKKVSANVCICKNEKDAIRNFKEGDILVIPQTSNEIFPILKKAAGIITELPGLNSHAAIAGLALDKPVIVGAENAVQLLKSGAFVTMDAARGTVESAGDSFPAAYSR